MQSKREIICDDETGTGEDDQLSVKEENIKIIHTYSEVLRRFNLWNKNKKRMKILS